MNDTFTPRLRQENHVTYVLDADASRSFTLFARLKELQVS